jgi:hypothetical protein
VTPPPDGKLATTRVVNHMRRVFVGEMELPIDPMWAKEATDDINVAADAWRDRAVEEEREAIAKHIEDHYWDSCGEAGEAHGKALAAAIRARSSK